MSQFIRQWRNDIRELGTPQFDAAAALREMMARRADIQKLASEDQRMALDLQDESRKKDAHPLELEGKRQANTSLGLANKRFPEQAAIEDEQNLRLRADEDQTRRADRVRALNTQLTNEVATGGVAPGDIAERAVGQARGVAAEAGVDQDLEGPPPAASDREVSLYAGEIARGAKAPVADEKLEGKRLQNEAQTKRELLKAQQRRVELAQRRLKDTSAAAARLNQQQIAYTNQKLKQYDTEFEAHTAEIGGLRAGIEFGTNLGETEIERYRAALIARGADPAGIRKIPGQKGYTVDDTALAGTIRGFKSIAPGAPGDKAMTAEMNDYVKAHQDLVQSRAVLDLMLGQDIYGAYGIPAAEPEAPGPASVKPPEPTRQPTPANGKVKRKPAKVQRYVSEETLDPSAADARDARVVAREDALKKINAVQVSASVWKHPNGKFYDINTGKQVADPRQQ